MGRRAALRFDEAQRLIALAKANDLPIAALDVRADGVTVHVAQPGDRLGGTGGSAFDEWLASSQQDQDRGRPAHRRQ